MLLELQRAELLKVRLQQQAGGETIFPLAAERFGVSGRFHTSPQGFFMEGFRRFGVAWGGPEWSGFDRALHGLRRGWYGHGVSQTSTRKGFMRAVEWFAEAGSRVCRVPQASRESPATRKSYGAARGGSEVMFHRSSTGFHTGSARVPHGEADSTRPSPAVQSGAPGARELQTITQPINHSVPFVLLRMPPSLQSNLFNSTAVLKWFGRGTYNAKSFSRAITKTDS